jgi:hypothetical protein
LVSVSVDADTRVTLMFGYCFSNALISTVRASLAPVPLSGLADQTMLPDVVDPRLLEEPLLLLLPLLALLLPLLPPQPARASAPTTPTTAEIRHVRPGLLPGNLSERSRIMRPPLNVVDL